MTQDSWDMQEEVDKRERICRILGSHELLMWYSMNNNEVTLAYHFAACLTAWARANCHHPEHTSDTTAIQEAIVWLRGRGRRVGR